MKVTHMTAFAFRVKRFFLSGNLRKEYFIAVGLAFATAATMFYFKASVDGGEFYWQVLVGIFTGFFVGFVVDAVESWHRIRFVSEILSHIRVEEPLPIVVANLSSRTDLGLEPNTGGSSYRYTGPGEAIAIGLLFSAYTNIFSTASRTVSTSNLFVLTPESTDEKVNATYSSQRLIFGGPIYNELTRLLLEKPEIKIQYPKGEQGNYVSRLELKDGTKKWSPDKEGKRDFGLVLKLGRQLHISGCLTWGVIGAATAVFSEAVASQLVRSLKDIGVDPISNDYFAVISCVVPNWDDHYSIGQVSIEESRVIQG
jgi:hypothetical protein